MHFSLSLGLAYLVQMRTRISMYLCWVKQKSTASALCCLLNSTCKNKTTPKCCDANNCDVACLTCLHCVLPVTCSIWVLFGRSANTSLSRLLFCVYFWQYPWQYVPGVGFESCKMTSPIIATKAQMPETNVFASSCERSRSGAQALWWSCTQQPCPHVLHNNKCAWVVWVQNHELACCRFLYKTSICRSCFESDDCKLSLVQCWCLFGNDGG